MNKRASGILMPVSSLPGPYGIGCFSKEARAFVDWLADAGQTLWQILPLGPTSYGDSPYQSFSTFAGNPYFIDLETLVQEGLLCAGDCAAADLGSDPSDIDYGKLYRNRWPLLRQAFAAWRAAGGPGEAEYRQFLAKNASGPTPCACAGRMPWPGPAANWGRKWPSSSLCSMNSTASGAG